MNSTEAVVLFQRALWMAMLLAAPMLLFGLVAGLVVSIFQAVTQIQEMTLTFVPKIIVVFLALLLTLPWIIEKLTTYTHNLFASIPTLIR